MAGDGLRAFLLPVLIGNWWELRLLALPAVYMEMILKKRIAAIERFLLFSIRAVYSDNLGQCAPVCIRCMNADGWICSR